MRYVAYNYAAYTAYCYRRIYGRFTYYSLADRSNLIVYNNILI